MVSVFQKNLLSAGPGNSRTLGMGRNLLRREILAKKRLSPYANSRILCRHFLALLFSLNHAILPV